MHVAGGFYAHGAAWWTEGDGVRARLGRIAAEREIQRAMNDFMNFSQCSDEWPEVEAHPLVPPAVGRLPRRPKKYQRRRSKDETSGKNLSTHQTGNGVRLSKKGVVMKCSFCKQPNHNARGCPKKPVSEKTTQGLDVPAANENARKATRSRINKPISASRSEGSNVLSTTNEVGGVATRSRTKNPASASPNETGRMATRANSKGTKRVLEVGVCGGAEPFKVATTQQSQNAHKAKKINIHKGKDKRNKTPEKARH
ncbi:gag-pol polyprotein [Striga asiatica]|uniref:Gag-pol polyprotein n=1 Tax=Striga asiatica TaxID=4170 RepID=A0A5A7PYG1_STRAF|nr:gag-pol polyprotein [Striga asiatica]